MSRDRTAQNAVRDQLVAAALAERRPRWRLRAAAIVAATVLGATAVAEATGLLAVGEPIETLMPPTEAARIERYEAPHGATVVVTASDPDYRFGWGVGIYTSPEGLECALVGQALGNQLGRERDGRFHPYGPHVIGSCGDLSVMEQMSDTLRVTTGPHPRTVLYGRTTKTDRPVVFEHLGERRSVRPGPGGAFLVVFDGVLKTNDIKLVG